jgi:hypothetical protein
MEEPVSIAKPVSQITFEERRFKNMGWYQGVGFPKAVKRRTWGFRWQRNGNYENRLEALSPRNHLEMSYNAPN